MADTLPGGVPTDAAALAARVVGFAAPAALTTTQDVVRAVWPALQDGTGAPPDAALVAEETLALVATVAARAAHAGLRARPDAAEAAVAALTELPLLVHDFLLGAQLVAEGAEGEVAPPDDGVYERLARKLGFYDVHLPAGAVPGPARLRTVLPLWMGRVSPPRLPTSPEARLATTGVEALVAVHARLVLAFAERAASPSTAG